MKKWIVLPLLVVAVPAFAGMTSSLETFEEEEYIEPSSSEVDEVQEMEDRKSEISLEEESIDYNDRTRTNRERKAINTGSDASDDQ